jgi:hypothetical protein
MVWGCGEKRRGRACWLSFIIIEVMMMMLHQMRYGRHSRGDMLNSRTAHSGVPNGQTRSTSDTAGKVTNFAWLGWAAVVVVGKFRDLHQLGRCDRASMRKARNKDHQQRSMTGCSSSIARSEHTQC